ncbi:peptidase C39 [Bifidobacterium eulemuris]|nr:peptidase C39 [Bifidobacterium eulemuris]
MDDYIPTAQRPKAESNTPSAPRTPSQNMLQRHWPLICVALVLVAALAVTGAGLLHRMQTRNSTTFADGTMSTDFDYTTIALDDDPQRYYSISDGTVPALDDLSQSTMDSMFPSAAVFEYPDGTYFTPLRLDERGVLYGEAKPSDDAQADTATQTNRLSLGAYDLAQQSFSMLAEKTDASTYETYRIAAASEGHALVELSDQHNQTSTYTLYDLDEGTSRELLSSTLMPNLHTTAAFFDADGVMLNRFDPEAEHYILEYHDFQGGVTPVERGNCSKAVKLGELWYYVLSDTATGESRLVELNVRNHTKTVLASTADGDRLGQPAMGGDSLFVPLIANGGVQIWRVAVADRTITPLLSLDVMEDDLQANERFLAWTGTPLVEGRNRLQTVLLDLETMTVLSQDNGGIYLSPDSLAWVRYKQPDASIAKGEVYTDRNSEIRYVRDMEQAVDPRQDSSHSAKPDDGADDSSSSHDADGNGSADGDTAGGDTDGNDTDGNNGTNDGSSDAQPNGGDQTQSVRLSVPTMLQDSNDWCGPAALQSVLRYKGIDVSQSTLAAELNTKPVTGTEYVDLARVANAYLFGVADANPSGAGYHVQTIAFGDTSVQTAQLFEQRVKTDMASNDPVFVAIDVAAMYDGFGHGNHMIVVTGYDTDANGAITHYRFIDSMRSVQDATYGGLKIVDAATMMRAIVTNEEPAYVW